MAVPPRIVFPSIELEAVTETRQAVLLQSHIEPLARSRPAEPVGPGRPDGDYALVCDAIALISTQYRDQPSLPEIAAALRVDPPTLETVFRRWSGLTPKAFLQAVTLDHARRLLAGGLPLLDTAIEVGLSGPSRLHDLFVKHEATSPGAFKARGAGERLSYGFAATPFGRALVLWTERGIAGIAFSDRDRGGDAHALADMRRRWPAAVFEESEEGAEPLLARVFDPAHWSADRPLRIVMIGTDFEIRVWEALLGIPVGEAATYSSVAERIGLPRASRAVGAAVGRNPISFVVPCHRVVGKGGALTGYHWGLTRKRAMLGWEAGVLARA